MQYDIQQEHTVAAYSSSIRTSYASSVLRSAARLGCYCTTLQHAAVCYCITLRRRGIHTSKTLRRMRILACVQRPTNARYQYGARDQRMHAISTAH
eukprot:3941074-Rhodomonas_salina.1